MRVLVTGGSGRIGQATIANLLAHGHDVVSADQQRLPGAGYRFVRTDMSDVGQVAGAMRDCDAVIHLAAIPTAFIDPDEVTFVNNAGATFAVLQAAALLNVGKAALASSMAILGTAFAPTQSYPDYAPVDEDHPVRPSDPYAHSKHVDELTAAMFHRQTRMQVAALRFTLVTFDAADLRRQAARLSDDQLPGWLGRVFWSYIDVHDAANALRLAVEADGFGCEVFNIAAADSLADRPTADLIQTHAPATELRASIPGTAAAISTEKACRLLGWSPRVSWRTLPANELLRVDINKFSRV